MTPQARRYDLPVSVRLCAIFTSASPKVTSKTSFYFDKFIKQKPCHGRLPLTDILGPFSLPSLIPTPIETDNLNYSMPSRNTDMRFGHRFYHECFKHIFWRPPLYSSYSDFLGSAFSKHINHLGAALGPLWFIKCSFFARLPPETWRSQPSTRSCEFYLSVLSPDPLRLAIQSFVTIEYSSASYMKMATARGFHVV